MLKFEVFYLFLLLFMFIGCTKPDESFIGVWSNKQSNGSGDLRLTITRDGYKLLVKEDIESKGIPLAMHSAKVEKGYLLIDGDLFFNKMSYSETEDSLIPVNNYLGMPLPPFHREK